MLFKKSHTYCLDTFPVWQIDAKASKSLNYIIIIFKNKCEWQFYNCPEANCHGIIWLYKKTTHNDGICVLPSIFTGNCYRHDIFYCSYLLLSLFWLVCTTFIGLPTSGHADTAKQTYVFKHTQIWFFLVNGKQSKMTIAAICEPMCRMLPDLTFLTLNIKNNKEKTDQILQIFNVNLCLGDSILLTFFFTNMYMNCNLKPIFKYVYNYMQPWHWMVNKEQYSVLL